MSKINGDKARKNLRDRKSTKMRLRLESLKKAAQKVSRKGARRPFNENFSGSAKHYWTSFERVSPR